MSPRSPERLILPRSTLSPTTLPSVLSGGGSPSNLLVPDPNLPRPGFAPSTSYPRLEPLPPRVPACPLVPDVCAPRTLGPTLSKITRLSSPPSWALLHLHLTSQIRVMNRLDPPVHLKVRYLRSWHRVSALPRPPAPNPSSTPTQRPRGPLTGLPLSHENSDYLLTVDVPRATFS
jgi:hypothetical protein